MAYKNILAVFIVSILFLVFGCIRDPVQLNQSVSNTTVNLSNGYGANASGLCSGPGLDEMAVRKCLYSYAYDTGDLSACGKIDLVSQSAPFSKGDCYFKIARRTMNASVCELIPENPGGPENQITNMCYYELAIITQNVSLCNKMAADYNFYCQPCPAGAMCAPCRGPLTISECRTRATVVYS